MGRNPWGCGLISDKDRGQLLRMAGNIAGGILSGANPFDADPKYEAAVAEVSVRVAYKILKDVDALIEVSR